MLGMLDMHSMPCRKVLCKFMLTQRRETPSYDQSQPGILIGSTERETQVSTNVTGK